MDAWLIPFVAIAASTVAALTDWRSGRIPNLLTASTCIVGLAIRSYCGGPEGAAESGIGIVACSLVPAILYQVTQARGIGGGDLKLFAALGALLGPSQGLEVEFSSFVLVAFIALFRMAYLGQLTRLLLSTLRVMVGLLGRPHAWDVEPLAMTEMRLGPAIAFAVVTVLVVPNVTRWIPWLM